MTLNLEQLWSLIPWQRREELKKQYGIKRSGTVEVENNTVVRDGVREGDLQGRITTEQLKAELGLNEKKAAYDIKEIKTAKKEAELKGKKNAKSNKNKDSEPATKKSVKGDNA